MKYTKKKMCVWTFIHTFSSNIGSMAGETYLTHMVNDDNYDPEKHRYLSKVKPDLEEWVEITIPEVSDDEKHQRAIQKVEDEIDELRTSYTKQKIRLEDKLAQLMALPAPEPLDFDDTKVPNYDE